MAGSTIYDIQFDDTILHGSNSNGFISLYGPDIPVGIPEPGETGNGLTIFPNPAEDYVYFRGSLDTPGASAEIISLGGQTMIIHEFPAVSAQYSVNVHDLSPGMYFIKLKSGNEIRTGKFVKR
jgi:hypothetical protein